jgi:hypothetical protein
MKIHGIALSDGEMSGKILQGWQVNSNCSAAVTQTVKLVLAHYPGMTDFDFVSSIPSPH